MTHFVKLSEVQEDGSTKPEHVNLETVTNIWVEEAGTYLGLIDGNTIGPFQETPEKILA